MKRGHDEDNGAGPGRQSPRVQPRRNDPAEWERANAAFLKWWAANKKDFKHNRSWVMAT